MARNDFVPDTTVSHMFKLSCVVSTSISAHYKFYEARQQNEIRNGVERSYLFSYSVAQALDLRKLPSFLHNFCLCHTRDRLLENGEGDAPYAYQALQPRYVAADRVHSFR